MLVLRSANDEHHELLPGATLGRSPAATFCVPTDGVSRLHARVSWEAEGWVVRDLGSRNGTWVNGVAVPPGGAWPLTAGTSLALGPAQWTVERADPPSAYATGPDGQIARGGPYDAHPADSGLLALPSADMPTVVVFRDGARWRVEDERGDRSAVNGEVLLVGGARWTLHLPEVLPATGAGNATTLEDARIDLQVSPDEEHVVGTLVLGARTIDLGARAHLYLLLTLARAREADLAAGTDPSLAGWLEVDRLARGLRVSPNALYIQSHRIRAQLAEAGVLGASGVIERRGRGAVRLGPIRVHVSSA